MTPSVALGDGGKGNDPLQSGQNLGNLLGSILRIDVDNTSRLVGQFPVCDFGEVIDPPTEDVTAHILEALVECGVPPGHPAVRAGLLYLRRTQRDEQAVGRHGRISIRSSRATKTRKTPLFRFRLKAGKKITILLPTVGMG